MTCAKIGSVPEELFVDLPSKRSQTVYHRPRHWNHTSVLQGTLYAQA